MQWKGNRPYFSINRETSCPEWIRKNSDEVWFCFVGCFCFCFSLGRKEKKKVLIDFITVLYKNVLTLWFLFVCFCFPGLDPDKHLGKTLDQMVPHLLEVSIT